MVILENGLPPRVSIFWRLNDSATLLNYLYSEYNLKILETTIDSDYTTFNDLFPFRSYPQTAPVAFIHDLAILMFLIARKNYDRLVIILLSRSCMRCQGSEHVVDYFAAVEVRSATL